MMYDNDDDYHSISSTNSDDEIEEEIHCHTHRSCSRYATCNGKQHAHTSAHSDQTLDIIDNLKAQKGDIRSINDQFGHRQKYDGMKWRRICSYADCLLYLNRGIFFKKWLCRKHYLLSISGTNKSIEQNPEIIISTKRKPSSKSSIQLIKEQTNFQRGDIRKNTKGTREKFNGQTWRPICNYKNCKSYALTRGYCHRHHNEINKKISSLDNIPQITKSSQLSIKKPKKGEIHSVRQQWNGTKWYSLCNYYTQDCPRRSQGIKCAYLCDLHYREYLTKQKETNLNKKNDRILLSPRVNRKKSVGYETPIAMPHSDPSTIDSMHNLSEQMTQTDLTYSPETADIRQGCFLIDDDNKQQQYQCDSPLVMIYIKNEDVTDDSSTNKHQIAIDTNSLAFNCKLEITKLEL